MIIEYIMSNKGYKKQFQILIIVFLIIILLYLIYFFILKEPTDKNKVDTPNTKITDIQEEVYEPINQQLSDDDISYLYSDTTKLTNESDFFKKININPDTQKCYYKIENLKGKPEEEFQMNMKDILNLLKQKPAIIFNLKNTELKPNSTINLLKDESGAERNLYNYKELGDLKLQLKKRVSSMGEKQYLQVYLSYNKQPLFAVSEYFSENYPKINLVTNNLTLYKAT